MATGTPGISATQLQRQLAIGRYETAWMMLQKLRRAMVNPEREPLTESVDVDEDSTASCAEAGSTERKPLSWWLRRSAERDPAAYA